MLHRSFKPAKCKTALKLAVSRIKLLNNKREVQIKQLRRELAQLLESGQVQTARIRVEHVVREEKTLTAYNLVEIYCELIVARLPVIESQKTCPIDLKEAVSSVIFATQRCSDIPELADIKKHLTAKYGKEFIVSAIEVRPDCGVNRMLIEKLSTKSPDGQTKLKILTAIAEEHNVKWDSASFSESDPKPPQDLLNGPNTFERASKAYTEAPPEPARPNRDDKRGNPNIETPPKLDEKFLSNAQNTRSSSGNYSSSSTFHPEERSTGYGNERREERKSIPRNENSSSFDKHDWSMQFKDATSAAQAAAESAELASLAARAAAELSRQHSSESRKSPAYPPKDEAPRVYAGSKLASGHISRDEENRTFNQRQPGRSDDVAFDRRTADKFDGPKGREERAGPTERLARDDHSNDDRYNNKASRKSDAVSTQDSSSTNSYSHRKSSKSDFIDGATMRNLSGESESTVDTHESLKPEEIVNIDYAVTRKESSLSRSSSFSDELEDVTRKNDDVTFDEDPNTSAYFHEDVFKRNDDIDSYRENLETISKENFAVFDDSGSDGDGYKEQETSAYSSSSLRKVPFHPSVFTESPEFSSHSAQPDDLPPASFDDYNYPSEEDDISKSKLTGITDLVQSEEDVSGDENPEFRSDPFSRSPPTFTPEVNQELSDGSKGIKLKPKTEKKPDEGELSSRKLASQRMRSRLESNVKNQEEEEEDEFADTTKDSELLNFGTLTGGLRNKGIRRPPYTRKTALEDTFSEKGDQSSSYSPRVTPSQRKSSLTFTKHGDSDTDYSDDESQKRTQKADSPLVKKPSSTAYSYFDSDDGDSDEDASKLSSPVPARPGAGISRRTKVSSSTSDRSNPKTSFLSEKDSTSEALPKTNVRAYSKTTPGYGGESKPSPRSSYVTEASPSKPFSETKSSYTSESKSNYFPVSVESEKSSPSYRAERRSSSKTTLSPEKQITPNYGVKSKSSSTKSGQNLPKTNPSYGGETKPSSRSSYVSEASKKPFSETKSSYTSESKPNYFPVSVKESEKSSPPRYGGESKPSSRSSYGSEASPKKPFSETKSSYTSQSKSNDFRVESEKSSPRYGGEKNPSLQSYSVTEASPKKPFSETKSSYASESKSNYFPVSVESEKSSPSYSGERKSSLQSSRVREASPKASKETRSFDHGGSREARHRSIEKDDSKPTSASSKPKSVTKSVTRIDSSNDNASHVHPNLPDSDSFTAFFQSLRQPRE